LRDWQQPGDRNLCLGAGNPELTAANPFGPKRWPLADAPGTLSLE
jgi:hypothetical protein